MAQGRNTGAFVFGAVLGGATGALIALWKTPYSGEELRARIGLPSDTELQAAAADARRALDELGGRALELVEQAGAAVVGVELGRTANGSKPQPESTPAE